MLCVWFCLFSYDIKGNVIFYFHGKSNFMVDRLFHRIVYRKVFKLAEIAGQSSVWVSLEYLHPEQLCSRLNWHFIQYCLDEPVETNIDCRLYPIGIKQSVNWRQNTVIIWSRTWNESSSFKAKHSCIVVEWLLPSRHFTSTDLTANAINIYEKEETHYTQYCKAVTLIV